MYVKLTVIRKSKYLNKVIDYQGYVQTKHMIKNVKIK